MRMKDFTHIPQLCVKGETSKIAEGSASPFLKGATSQYLSTNTTFGNGYRIQALPFSSFVCIFASKLSLMRTYVPLVTDAYIRLNSKLTHNLAAKRCTHKLRIF